MLELMVSGMWVLVLKDGRELEFYIDELPVNKIHESPLQRYFEDFSVDHFWSIDIYPDTYEFDTDPYDEDYYLVPKNLVDYVEFRPITR